MDEKEKNESEKKSFSSTGRANNMGNPEDREPSPGGVVAGIDAAFSVPREVKEKRRRESIEQQKLLEMQKDELKSEEKDE